MPINKLRTKLHEALVHARGPREHDHLSLIIIGITLAVMLFIAMGILQEVQAQNYISKAEEAISVSQFDKAVVQFEKAAKYWSLPSTRRSISESLARNKEWARYQEDFSTAEKLIEDKKLEEALQLLSGIPSGYPNYEKVSSLTSSLSAFLAQNASRVSVSESNVGRESPTIDEIAQTISKVELHPIIGMRYGEAKFRSNIISASSLSQIEGLINIFLAQYGVSAHITDIKEPAYATTWNNLQESDLKAVQLLSLMFIDEFAKYPVSFIKDSKLIRINFVRDVTMNGLKLTAYPGSSQVGSMFLGTGVNAHIVHHEIAHYIHSAFASKATIDQNKWTLVYNKPPFRYGSGGTSAYGAAAIYDTYEHPIEGLVTEYASYAFIEDIAEIHGYLMVNDEFKRLNQWFQDDYYLRDKVTAYQFYLSQLSPEFVRGVDYFLSINP